MIFRVLMLTMTVVPLHAAVTLNVEVAESVQAGESTDVIFSITSDVAVAPVDQIEALNFPIDVGPNGNLLPSGVNFAAVPVTPGPGFGLTSGDGLNLDLNPTGIDGIVNVSTNSPVNVSSDPLNATVLFTLHFDTLLSTSPDSYPVVIETGAAQFTLTGFSGGVAQPAFVPSTVNNGSVNVTAVPEPTAFALLGLIFGLCAIRQWHAKSSE